MGKEAGILRVSGTVLGLVVLHWSCVRRAHGRRIENRADASPADVMDRPSRRGANKAAKAEAAAAQLKNLREKGLKRIDTVAEAEDNAVYDVVTDEEYAKIVNKRREEYGGFVVGEDGDECVPFPFPAFALPALHPNTHS